MWPSQQSKPAASGEVDELKAKIKKMEEEAKNETEDRLDAINLEKGRLRKLNNLKPHPLFMRFFEAFVEKRTE